MILYLPGLQPFIQMLVDACIGLQENGHVGELYSKLDKRELQILKYKQLHRIKL